ncbi:MBL fold metallo-hydrolase [Chitinimonas sp. BJB300]|uniref:MBL fold metallo-hydrolase n=1 Tax=Chitinimonas sp. BJB300 TaxID=1559339 RepID=UPI000C0EE6D0|nr:MBL fold metallo-hydrolase [Chitinimonas sp. BJB300]PHV13225.1 Zn-dependent hydrolase [Chitinimonas sp. BJB300]TSJ89618.1 MBL fold metallo-hydrolase [Chitinimonas sp. BJB300]
MPNRLSYPLHDQLLDPGQTIEVVPGVHWLKMPLPFALNHINLWLLREERGWTVVDTGFDAEDSRALWEQLFSGAMAGLPIQRVVVTHYHPDHIGLADWLAQRFTAPFYCSLGEFASAHAAWHGLPGFDVVALNAHFGRHGLPASKAIQYRERGNSYRFGVKSLPVSFNRILAGDTLAMGGVDWVTIPGYGHSPEHMALYSKEKQCLIAGDMLLPKISTNVGTWATDPDADALKPFLASLDRFLDLPEDTLVLPSHGRPFRGIQPRVAALHAHHQERLGALIAAIQRPMTAFELLPVLFGRVFDLYQTMFALAECIAHLNHLWHAGILRRQQDADLCYRFSRV